MTKLVSPILVPIISLFAIAVLSGCASRDMYDWGEYETSIRRMYNSDFRTDKEIAILTEEIDKTKTAGGMVPPGKMLHLGYLFYLSGDTDSAKRWFEEEKMTFPESQVFVDGLIRRMGS